MLFSRRAAQGRKIEFIEALLDFIKSSNLGAALFLSGVDPLHRNDSQMLCVIQRLLFFVVTRRFTFCIGRTPTFQIRLVNTQQLAGTPLHDLLNLPIPLYSSPVQPNPYLDQDGGSKSTLPLQIPFIPGGGLTRRILSSISTSKWEIPVASLVHFAMEGDNRADAGLLASVVAKLLGIEVPQWKQPSSWHVGLFGATHDQSLYG